MVSRATLVERGVRVGEIFHDATGVFHHAGTADRVPGPAPDRRSYGSFMAMAGPEGSGWGGQGVPQGGPRRSTHASHGARADLASALRAAAAAHGAHEGRLGHEDANWPEWYADYLLNEQLGQPLPG